MEPTPIPNSPPPSYDDLRPLSPPVPASSSSLRPSNSSSDLAGDRDPSSPSSSFLPLAATVRQWDPNAKLERLSWSSSDEDLLGLNEFEEEETHFRPPSPVERRYHPDSAIRRYRSTPIIVVDNTLPRSSHPSNPASTPSSSHHRSSTTPHSNPYQEEDDPPDAPFAHSVSIPSYQIVGQTTTISSPSTPSTSSSASATGGGGVGGIGCWVVYEIQIVLVGGGGVVTERKRYSQFETLKVELRKAYPHLRLVIGSLPPKSQLSKFRESFLEKRRKRLQEWLRIILLHPELGSSNVVKDWLLTS